MLRNRQAFTLIELSIVLLIVSMMIGFGMQAFQSTAVTDCYEKTAGQLRVIDQALQDYAVINRRLPKPAMYKWGSNDPSFGAEAQGNQTDPSMANYGANNANGVPSGMTSTGGVLIGSIPHTTLALPVEFASDCWGTKFTYAVTNVLTSSNASSGYPSGAAGAITLKSGTVTASTTLSTTMNYVILSHGIDRFGGTPMAATTTTARNCDSTSETKIDAQNCNTSDAVFFNSYRNIGDNAGSSYFDDVVFYGGGAAAPTTAGSNLYCWGSSTGGSAADDNTAFHNLSKPTRSPSTVQFANLAQRLAGVGPSTTTWVYSACGLTSDGSAYCWGDNNYSEIGNGTSTNAGVPTAVSTSVKFDKLYSANFYNIGLTSDGTAYWWGHDFFDGVGTQSTPLAFNTTSKYSKIIVNDYTGCGLRTDGIPECWSSVATNLTGTGSLTPASGSNVPVAVSGGHKFSTIENAYSLICGLTNSDDAGGAGKLYCWGDPNKNTGYDDPRPHASVLGNGAGITITSISKNASPVVQTSVAHGLSVGDYITINGVTGSGTPSIAALNNEIYQVKSVTNATKFVLNGVDTSVYGSAGSGGTLQLVGPSTPRLSANNMTFQYYYGGTRGIDATGKLYTWGTMLFAQPGSGGTLGTNYGRYTDPAKVAIDSMTATNPASITTATAHGLSAGQIVFVSSDNKSSASRKYFTVGTVTNSTTFTLNTLGGVAVDGTGWYILSGGKGTLFKALPSGPYQSIEGHFATFTNTPVAASGSLNFLTYDGNVPVPLYNTPSLNPGLSVAMTTAGTIYTWGMDMGGAFGNNNLNVYKKTGTSSESQIVTTPQSVTMPSGKTFAKYYQYQPGNYAAVCALTTANDVYCWGDYSATGTGFGSDEYVPILQQTPAGEAAPAKFKQLIFDGIKCGITP